MSYDVYVGQAWFNYTFNGSSIFYEHIPPKGEGRGGLHELHGKTGRQAAGIIREALDRIDRTRVECWGTRTMGGDAVFCAKYDPPNGWGSTLGAILFLSRILAACAASPRCKVRVHA